MDGRGKSGMFVECRQCPRKVGNVQGSVNVEEECLEVGGRTEDVGPFSSDWSKRAVTPPQIRCPSLAFVAVAIDVPTV